MSEHYLHFGYVSSTTNRRHIDAIVDRGVHPRNLSIDRYVPSRGARYRRLPGLSTVLLRARAGDTLVVWRLFCLGPSIKQIAGVWRILRTEEVRLISIHDGLDSATFYGRLFLDAIEVRAVQRSREARIQTLAGLARARANGRSSGRPRSLGPAKREQALKLLAQHPMREVARAIGVSRATLYNAGLRARPTRSKK